ncbi:MAG: ATP-binding cassette domain-containing protein, partial [Pseudomonadota bacterium]
AGARPPKIQEAMAGPYEGLRLTARAKTDLACADVALALVAPISSVIVLLIATLQGRSGHDLLPAVFAAFIILAFGELLGSAARQFFSLKEKQRAETRLAHWTEEPSTPSGTLTTVLPLTRFELVTPVGSSLGNTAYVALEPCTSHALLGPSGCGKSTLLKHLAGWMPWPHGKHPLGSAATVRSAVHLCLHDAAILTGTVRDNLFSDAHDDVLWAALDDVQLREKIGELGGLDADVSQGAFSLGEARRMALARAALSPSPLIFLDEPGEHLDPGQGKHVVKRVLERLGDKAVLYVTHDAELAGLANRQTVVERRID